MDYILSHNNGCCFVIFDNNASNKNLKALLLCCCAFVLLPHLVFSLIFVAVVVVLFRCAFLWLPPHWYRLIVDFLLFEER